MKILLIITIALATRIAAFSSSAFNANLSSAGVAENNNVYDLKNARKLFDKFLTDYNKQYANDEEKAMRYKIFKHNIESINLRNSRNDTAVYAINRFSDLTPKEIVTKHTGLASGHIKKKFCDTIVVDGPPPSPYPNNNFDWRAYGKVTAVKEQGQCGACWAFATLGSLESQYAIKYNRHIDLSEQQLVDCDRVNYGCDGGLLHTAFEEIMAMGGVQHETAYPYAAANAPCKMIPAGFITGAVSCFRYILRNERRLEGLVRSVGPVAVAIDAVDITNYYGGIVSYCENNGLNHAVLVVGYGVERDVPYWIIKNSWGASYGENGYVRIRRGVNACGLMNDLAASAVVT